MHRLEGTHDFTLPAARLWPRLTDMRFLTRCVPDVATVKEAGAESAALVLRPGFSFVRGELQLTLLKVAATPLVAATILGKTKGVGTSSEVEAGFRLEELATGTRLHWTADVKHLGGLLKAVPQGLIQAAAQRVIGDLMQGIERNLATPPAD